MHLTEVYDKVTLVEVEVERTVRRHAYHTALATHRQSPAAMIIAPAEDQRVCRVVYYVSENSTYPFSYF